MLPDPSRSWAVLVGASEFRDSSLDDLPTVGAGVERLRELLMDPSVWGLPPSRCTVVSNPQSGDELLDPIASGCASAEDAFFLYYAGHGILDPRPAELYLATAATTLSPILRALRFDDVRRVLEPKKKLAKVVILDCCYSGLAIAGTMSDGIKVSDQLLVNRSYIMTATTRTRLALAPPDEAYPAFTGELIRVLSDGVDGGPDELTMASIYGQVLNGLTVKRRPKPQASADNDGHSIVLARNRALLVPTGGTPAAAEQPPEPTRRPPSSARYAPVLDLTPSRTVEYLAALDDGKRVAAVEVFARWRDPQELAAVVHALRRADLAPVADMVVADVVRRPADDILDTVENLDVLGLGGVVDDLLRAAGHTGDALVCALSPRLPEPRRDVLIEAAVRHFVGTEPTATIRLVGMLWATESRPAVERVLRAVATTMPPEEAAVLADTLSDGGYDEAAFLPYTVAEDVVATRPPRSAVQVVVSMDRAGHHEWAQRLLVRVVDRCTDAAIAFDAVEALRTAGLTEAAEDFLETMAARLDDEQVMGLALRLRAGERADERLDVLKRAASRRPVASTQEYFRFLFDLGQGMNARRLLEHVGTFLDGASLASAAVFVDELVPAAAYSSDLVRAAAAREPACGRDLLVHLDAQPDLVSRRLADLAEQAIAEVSPEHGLIVAALLMRGWQIAAGNVVRAVAERFESSDVVTAFVRTVDEIVRKELRREEPAPEIDLGPPVYWPFMDRDQSRRDRSSAGGPRVLRIPVPPGPDRPAGPEHDIASTLRDDSHLAAELFALLILALPAGGEGKAVLRTLLELVPEATGHLVAWLLEEDALRRSVTRADLWQCFPTYPGEILKQRAVPFETRLAQAFELKIGYGLVDQVILNGSLAEIDELLQRSDALGLDGQSVLDAFGWGDEDSVARVDLRDPRRFHVAERFLRRQGGPQPLLPLALPRPTVAAIAVSWSVRSWAVPDFELFIPDPRYLQDVGLRPDPGDEVLCVGSIDRTDVVALTATGVRFRLHARRWQAPIPYADLAEVRFEAPDDHSVQILRPGGPPGLLDRFAEAMNAGRTDVTQTPYAAAELAHWLTDMASLVREVLTVSPDVPPPWNPAGRPGVARRRAFRSRGRPSPAP